MDRIIILGTGGHAVSCIDAVEQEGRFEIAGLVGEDLAVDEEVLGYPFVGSDGNLEELREKYGCALIGVGQIKSPDTRIRLYRILKDLKYKLPVVCSPFGYVSKHADIGEGSVVMHGAVVNAGATIGANCIINNQALVDHHAKIGSHCHIATGATVNGDVQVGEGTFVGSGVVTRQRVTIGRHCVVGAGCVVKEDLPDDWVLRNGPAHHTDHR